MPQGSVFIVMPKLEESMKDLVFSYSFKMKVKDVIKVGIKMIQILEGLHSLGICHLDIKPDNIMTSVKYKDLNASTCSIREPHEREIKLIDLGQA